MHSHGSSEDSLGWEEVSQEIMDVEGTPLGAAAKGLAESGC